MKTVNIMLAVFFVLGATKKEKEWKRDVLLINEK